MDANVYEAIRGYLLTNVIRNQERSLQEEEFFSGNTRGFTS